MQEKYSNILLDICYLNRIGNDFLDNALKIYQEADKGQGDSNHSFDLLVSHALENLIKSILALHIFLCKYSQTEEKITTSIKAEFYRIDHNLDYAFKSVPILMQALKINSVKRTQGTAGLVDQFVLKIGDNQIIIRHTMGARYGSYAKQKNCFVSWDELLFQFLKDFKIKSQKIFLELENKIRNK